MFLENEDAEECLSGTLDVAANSVVHLKKYIFGGTFFLTQFLLLSSDFIFDFYIHAHIVYGP